MPMRARLGCSMVALVVLLTTNHASASPWVVRIEGGSANYSQRTLSSYFPGYTELSLVGDKAYSFAAEYRTSPRTGIELSVSSIDLDARWRRVEIRPISLDPIVLREFTVDSDQGTFSLRPISITALVHPLRRERLDFFIGPQFSWVEFDRGLESLPRREAEWGIGGKAGLEFRLAQSPWSAGLSYRFVDTQHEGLERDQYTGISVHVVSAAVSYRVGRGGT